jgi:DNA repair protein NreA
MYPCAVCKGRDCKKYFGTDFCPLKTKLRAIALSKAASINLPKEFSTKVPGVFVSRFGYPDVSFGVTHSITGSDMSFMSNRAISKSNVPMQNVIDSRMSMLSLQKKGNIKVLDSQSIVVQHVALSRRAPMIDISLSTAPKFSFSIEPNAPPFGGRAELKNISESENISIDSLAGKVYYDTDLKARDAMTMLSKKFDEQRISEMLSSGAIGIGSKRRIVPTRWSITATDDSIGKEIITRINGYDRVDSPRLFTGSYFGNYYYVLLIPGIFSYELFENHMPSNSVMHDFELAKKRTSYAYDTAGGYYAARLAILQYLDSMKIQASVIALRLISKEYNTPLGVWVVREAVRNAMQSSPVNFDDNDIMVRFAISHANKHHSFDIASMIRDSVILDFIKKQRTLSDF